MEFLIGKQNDGVEIVWEGGEGEKGRMGGMV